MPSFRYYISTYLGYPVQPTNTTFLYIGYITRSRLVTELSLASGSVPRPLREREEAPLARTQKGTGRQNPTVHWSSLIIMRSGKKSYQLVLTTDLVLV